METILSTIKPVLQGMPDSHLKEQLLKYFPTQEASFTSIEKSFTMLTSGVQDKDALRNFFHSWSQTNNSAMTVAGLSNRITMLVHKDAPVADEHSLFKSVASLNRIVDEDLAVVGRVLHSEIFYQMATSIVGDDKWLTREYLHPAAKDFKTWKDHNSLRVKDIMIGLLTTLVHEIYTHGEVEYILPKFTSWLAADYGFTEKEIDLSVAWISVHCGPTEKDHFFHAVSSINYFVKAMNVDLTQYDLAGIISDYLVKKAAVMEAVGAKLTVTA